MLSRTVLNKHIKQCLSILGLDSEQQSGHSLRAEDVTDAAKRGLSDWEISILGRWAGDSCEHYVRLLAQYWASLASIMLVTDTNRCSNSF